MRSRILAAVAGVLAAVSARADDPLTPDLAMVPGNAVGFAHVRLADVWKNDALIDARNIFTKAGPAAIQSLDARFTPAPSTIDRLTAVAFLAKKPGNSPLDAVEPVVIARFTTAFDADKVRAAHLPKGEKKTVGGKDVYVSEADGFALAFIDDRTLVFGEVGGVTTVVGGTSRPTGAMAAAVKAAAGKHVFAAVNVAALPIPAEAAEQLPEEYRPLLKTAMVTVGLDIGKAVSAEVKLAYATAADAEAGDKALRAAMKAGRVLLDQQRQQLTAGMIAPPKPGEQLGQLPEAVALVVALGGLNTVDEILADPPMKRTGTDIAATVTLPAWGTQYVATAAIAAGLALPAAQKVRVASARAQSQNNMKQIGLALHNYHDVHGTFPPAAICDKKGKKLLSWRVAILPYIEQDNVYRMFKLDEAWDSPNNKKWSDVAIKTYIDPRAPAGKPTLTHYKVFVGNGAMFDWVQGVKITNISDGSSNTIMTVAGGDPVPWAKPDDIEFDPKADFPDLAKAFDGQLLVGMGDGSVRVIDTRSKKLTQDTLKALVTRAGGEVIAFDF